MDEIIHGDTTMDNTDNNGQRIEKDLVIEDALSVSYITPKKGYCYFI